MKPTYSTYNQQYDNDTYNISLDVDVLLMQFFNHDDF